MIVVYVYIVGDILHKGHLLHLENGKALGDILVVGVLTDEAVMEKKLKPTIPFSERLDIVKSLNMVDVTVPQNTYSPVSNIMDIRPDIILESNSHNVEVWLATKEAADVIDARLLIMPYSPITSSTTIKKRIIDGN
jgi:cytidyltransferase-like protein